MKKNSTPLPLWFNLIPRNHYLNILESKLLDDASHNNWFKRRFKKILKNSSPIVVYPILGDHDLFKLESVQVTYYLDEK